MPLPESCVALSLAAVGIYGVVADAVAQRRSEIGIRVALGALPGDIVLLVLRQGLVWVAPGVLVGLLVSAGLARTVSSLLFGVEATDPLVHGIAASTLALAGFAASLLPAHRALAIDAAESLRAE